jgi:hypothetical protein
MHHPIHWAKLDGRGGRIVSKVIIAFPVDHGAYRARHKTTAAIRAGVAEQAGAIAAKGTFKAANHRIRGMGRQQFVAVFASGA